MATILEEGVYKGTVSDWGLAKSAKKGTPYADFKVVLTHREVKGAWEELDLPAKRSMPIWLTSGCLEISLASLRHLGLDDGDIRRIDPDHEEAVDFGGVEVEVGLKHETYIDREGNERRSEKIQLRRNSRRIAALEIGDDLVELAQRPHVTAMSEPAPTPADTPAAAKGAGAKAGRKKKGVRA